MEHCVRSDHERGEQAGDTGIRNLRSESKLRMRFEGKPVCKLRRIAYANCLWAGELWCVNATCDNAPWFHRSAVGRYWGERAVDRVDA